MTTAPRLPEEPAPLARSRHGELAAASRTFGTFGDYNWVGLWTLYVKEVRRFFKVVTQAVLAPVVTTLLFLAIFALALGRGGRTVGDLPFLEFLAPGLIMMAVVQNAFANTSSSLIIAKIQGNIVDYLMPPLSPGELLLGLVGGGITRGIVVGLAVGLAMLPFVPLGIQAPLLAVYYLLSASMMLAALGVLAGLWAEKFDQVAAITNFVVTPLSFLSGTFYSIERLPAAAHTVALGNPFFYMIDGFRYALTGHADGAIWIGVLFLALVNLALWLVCLHLIRIGYKLKA
ncbi:MAG TPA: multidrug ABC transporter permease [Rhodospirillales bacterium]|nr:multidrug ABC transporter permease [Rhodospirillales bacterium]